MSADQNGRLAWSQGVDRPVEVVDGDLGAVAGFDEDVADLVVVQRGSALAAVVVEGPAVGLAVGLPDQVLASSRQSRIRLDR